MGRWAGFVLLVLVAAAMASGCTARSGGEWNGTSNETTTYEYYNATHAAGGNESEADGMKRDFTFKLIGENEFWLKANDSMGFDIVFNNLEGDGESHMFIARVSPSAADFDVMAAYKCLHFTTCDALLSRMRLMIDQPETPVSVKYGFVGIHLIGIRIPSGTPGGTYMYNVVACRDISFAGCNETTTNFGPNVPIVVHVL